MNRARSFLRWKSEWPLVLRPAYILPAFAITMFWGEWLIWFFLIFFDVLLFGG